MKKAGLVIWGSALPRGTSQPATLEPYNGARGRPDDADEDGVDGGCHRLPKRANHKMHITLYSKGCVQHSTFRQIMAAARYISHNLFDDVVLHVEKQVQRSVVLDAAGSQCFDHVLCKGSGRKRTICGVCRRQFLCPFPCEISDKPGRLLILLMYLARISSALWRLLGGEPCTQMVS